MKDWIEEIMKLSTSHPTRTAVIDGDLEYSYQELHSNVLNIAHYLIDHKIKKVLLNVDQGFLSYAVILATLYINGCYCPINISSPSERKLQILNDFKPDLIISETPMDALPADTFAECTFLELEKYKHSNKALDIQIDEENISYVIYTSGSTGIPKGVMIKQKALYKFLEWSTTTYGCNSQTKWSQFSNLSFDLSIIDIFTCLSCGGTLVTFIGYGQKLRPQKRIDAFQITIWHSVPSVVDLLIKNDSDGSVNLSSLKIMSFCGEPLYKYHLEYLFEKNPDLIILNTYGPTEATLFCTWIKLTKDNYMQYCQNNVSVGNIIPGWQYFLEEDDNGDQEMIIYGEYIGAGYLNISNDAYQTKVINGLEESIYRTGDIMKLLDEKLYFLHRKDNQVKIRGHRIELDEIDNILREFTCKQCISIQHNKEVHTFIEGYSGRKTDLINFLKCKLELYKIPSDFYTIDSFPKNSNLKTDKSELKKIIDEKRTVNIPI